MEAFLSTLPPYVHEFIDKYPPTDVFNLLKELICFAVLYSDDRARINQSTEEFLKKRKQHSEDQQDQLEEEATEDQDAVVPEPAHTSHIQSIKEETETEILNLEEAKPTYNIRTGELIHTEKSKMPNTFPEWWGHHEAEPAVSRKETVIPPTDNNDPKAETVGPVWIAWENNTTASNHTNHHRMERARSQIIPDLRSYLEDNKKADGSRTTPNSSSTTATKKRHSMMNMKTSTPPVSRSSITSSKINTSPSPTPTPPPASAATKASRRLSAPVCDSPTTTTTHSSKYEQATIRKKLTSTPPQIKTSNTPSTAPSPPARTGSLNMRQPRPNAAMRARAEHARLQQEELERKKNAPAIGSSSASLRIKQRANSGIDWSTIKQTRRKTVAEIPKTQ